MNELANGAVGIASVSFIGGMFVIGLLAWFFVTRASVRANEQIRLMAALLDEQKRQSALLERLAEQRGGTQQPVDDSAQQQDFTRLIPKR